jgi:hypothetical protein
VSPQGVGLCIPRPPPAPRRQRDRVDDVPSRTRIPSEDVPYDGTPIRMKFDTGDDTVIDADVNIEGDGSLTFTNVSTPFEDRSVLAIFGALFGRWDKM